MSEFEGLGGEDAEGDAEDEFEQIWDKYFDGKGVIVLKDLPFDVQLGFDGTTYDIKSTCRGFSGIPHGLHLLTLSPFDFNVFIYINETNFLFTIQIGNSHNPVLSVHSSDDLSGRALRQYIVKENRFFYSYPIQHISIWKNLTSYIDSQVLKSSNIYFFEPFTVNGDRSSLSFLDLQISERRYIETTFVTLSGSERTNLQMDKSQFLYSLLDNNGMASGSLLGNFQLAFISFLFMQCLSALQQWKYLCSTISISANFILKNKAFTKAFLLCMFHQLNFVDADFVSDELNSDCFLFPAIGVLLLNLKDEKDPELLEIERRLTTFIEKKYDLNYDALLQLGEGADAVDTVHLNFHYTAAQIGDPLPNIMNEHDQMFCWRYPLLYAEKIKSDGREDFLMTARRVLDECNEQTLCLEAAGFIQNETQFLK